MDGATFCQVFHPKRLEPVTRFGALLLWLGGGDPRPDLTTCAQGVYKPFSEIHALAAVSTGGFSNHNDRLAGVGGLGVQIVASAMSFCGAISLMVYMRGHQGRWEGMVQDPGMRALLWLTPASALLISLFMVLVGDRPLAEALRQGSLIAVSAQTSTGFSTLNVQVLDAASKLTLVGSMFIGGSALRKRPPAGVD